MSLASKLPRFRWLLPAFVVLVGVVLTIVMHWDDRAGLWWKESQASQQQRDESIWLPGYRVVIDAKPLRGLEEEETSDLAYNPATRTLFTVTGKRPLLVELSLTGDVLRTIPLLGLSNPEGVAVLENGNVAVTDERRNTLTIFHVDPQTAELSTKSLAEFPLGNIGKKNKGFEGIAWDPRQQRLLLSKERDPMTLFSWKSDGGPSLSGAMTALPSDDLYMRNVRPSASTRVPAIPWCCRPNRICCWSWTRRASRSASSACSAASTVWTARSRAPKGWPSTTRAPSTWSASRTCSTCSARRAASAWPPATPIKLRLSAD